MRAYRVFNKNICRAQAVLSFSEGALTDHANCCTHFSPLPDRCFADLKRDRVLAVSD